MIRTVALVLSLTLAACGGSAKQEASVPTPGPTAASSSVFELGEVTMLEGDNAMLKLHPDGSSEVASHRGTMVLKPGETASTDSLAVVWEAGPTLKTDGTMVVKGEAVVQVNSDGTVTDLKTKTVLPLVVSADKVTITEGGKQLTISLDANGSLAVAPGSAMPDKHPHVTGAATAGKRRAVLAFIGLTFAHGEVHTSSVTSVTSEGPAAAPAPAPVIKK
ncbi:hypothetical protein BH11MYX1_BH11MYX1_43460 [soil metagenome]